VSSYKGLDNHIALIFRVKQSRKLVLLKHGDTALHPRRLLFSKTLKLVQQNACGVGRFE
jgi:hypothetical protein